MMAGREMCCKETDFVLSCLYLLVLVKHITYWQLKEVCRLETAMPAWWTCASTNSAPAIRSVMQLCHILWKPLFGQCQRVEHHYSTWLIEHGFWVCSYLCLLKVLAWGLRVLVAFCFPLTYFCSAVRAGIIQLWRVETMQIFWFLVLFLIFIYFTFGWLHCMTVWFCDTVCWCSFRCAAFVHASQQVEKVLSRKVDLPGEVIV